MENGTEDATVERIRKRAYALWEEEGRPPDRAEHHWHRAVAEIAAQDAYGLDAGAVRRMRRSARGKPNQSQA